jgi:hypothetical protein
MRRRTLAAVAAVAAISGCSLHPRSPLPPTREGEWALVRDAATRRTVLYDRFTHRATATATHLSLVVREARARRLAEWLRWTPQELESRLAAERAEAEAGEEFLLCFYTADSRANDLDAPRSVWRIALRVGEGDLLATRVTSIDSDATVVGLFPFVGPFDVVYRVSLPRPADGPIDGKPFVLALSSTLGLVDLDYGAPITKIVDAPWQPVPPP